MVRKSLKNSKNFIFWKTFAKLQNSPPKKKNIGEHKTNVLNDIFSIVMWNRSLIFKWNQQMPKSQFVKQVVIC
jgi:hypothetical protein